MVKHQLQNDLIVDSETGYIVVRVVRAHISSGYSLSDGRKVYVFTFLCQIYGSLLLTKQYTHIFNLTLAKQIFKSNGTCTLNKTVPIL